MSITKLSSCLVELVFSQLKLIVDEVVHNKTEDITELRMFLMCNGDLNVYNTESYGDQKYCTSYY